ncbi:MAG TPA: ATP-dependent DNA helicase [Microthrixaceae bacterium]|nr:ATP-dependent DNA helicase [Microthrixaceae bacterium]
MAALDAGEDRPQQREMVRAVAHAFESGHHLAVQGPTGVGKSVAYLIPAIATARLGGGHRTVVVTSSKALQDQLGRHDLPFLADALGVPVRFSVLKGRANYLCQAAVAETRVQLGIGEEQQTFDLGDAAPAVATGPDRAALEAELVGLLDWAEDTTSGELADLDDPPSDAAWSALSVSPGECVGKSRCGHADDCFSEQAREAADRADVVVVNAHLYAAHVQAGGQLLPEHDQLIIDEAHEFEDAMVGALGVSMTGWRLRNLATTHDRCVADSPTIGMALSASADQLDDALAAAYRAAMDDHRSGRIKGELSEDVLGALGDAGVAVERATDSLRSTAKAAGNAPGSTAAHRFDRALRNSDAVADALDALASELHRGQVRWISEGRSGRHTLQLTRIDIASTLRAMAWEREDVRDGSTSVSPSGQDRSDGKAGAGTAEHSSADASGRLAAGPSGNGRSGDGPTVVLCSATLDPGTAWRLGLDAQYLAVDSPFDFKRNGLLYVPKMPKPSADAWPDAVAEELVHIIERCDGRTLALFTSHRMLRRSVESVRKRLPRMTILAQGDAPNRVLQDRFLADEHASLFATASFWTGISSPGTTCSAVVVDKIPFPVPTDPIVEARCDAVGDDRAFMEVSVPAAGMQLAQGVGRLIRTATDRGVVAVLDPRLAEARYRARMLDRLPRMKRTRDRSDLDAFIDSLDLD